MIFTWFILPAFFFLAACGHLLLDRSLSAGEEPNVIPVPSDVGDSLSSGRGAAVAHARSFRALEARVRRRDRGGGRGRRGRAARRDFAIDSN